MRQRTAYLCCCCCCVGRSGFEIVSLHMLFHSHVLLPLLSSSSSIPGGHANHMSSPIQYVVAVAVVVVAVAVAVVDDVVAVVVAGAWLIASTTASQGPLLFLAREYKVVALAVQGHLHVGV